MLNDSLLISLLAIGAMLSSCSNETANEYSLIPDATWPESEYLEVYPSEIDSVIQSRLDINYDLKYYEISAVSVYHPTVATTTEKDNVQTISEPYIDRELYSIAVLVDLIGIEEEWHYELDTEYNLLRENLSEGNEGGYTITTTYTVE
jgi:hypothetical protein